MKKLAMVVLLVAAGACRRTVAVQSPSTVQNANTPGGATPRELKSVAEVLQAESAGELTIEQPGVVINMPFVVWDGGQR